MQQALHCYIPTGIVFLLEPQSSYSIHYSAIAEHISLQYHCEWRGRQLSIFAPKKICVFQLVKLQVRIRVSLIGLGLDLI